MCFLVHNINRLVSMFLFNDITSICWDIIHPVLRISSKFILDSGWKCFKVYLPYGMDHIITCMDQLEETHPSEKGQFKIFGFNYPFSRIRHVYLISAEVLSRKTTESLDRITQSGLQRKVKKSYFVFWVIDRSCKVYSVNFTLRSMT